MTPEEASLYEVWEKQFEYRHPRLSEREGAIEEMISEIEERAKRITSLSQQDTLTLLFLRRYLQEKFR